MSRVVLCGAVLAVACILLVAGQTEPAAADHVKKGELTELEYIVSLPNARAVIAYLLEEGLTEIEDCANLKDRTVVDWSLLKIPCDLKEEPFYLPGANLTGSEIIDNNFFTVVDWSHVILDDAILRHAHFENGADMRNASMRGADMALAHLIGAKLTDADLNGATMVRANLEGADLTDATLRGADMRVAFLKDADLKRADLSHANLNYAFLLGANLHGARLYNTTLEKGTLYGVNLTGADLRHANMVGAEVWTATLSGADLSHVNLTKARFFANITLTTFADEQICTHDYCAVHDIKRWYSLAQPFLSIIETVVTGVQGITKSVLKVGKEAAGDNAATLIQTLQRSNGAGFSRPLDDVKGFTPWLSWKSGSGLQTDIAIMPTIKSNAPDVEVLANAAAGEFKKHVFLPEAKERAQDIEHDVFGSLARAGVYALGFSATGAGFDIAERVFGREGDVFVGTGHLYNATLNHADLDGADMRQARLIEADMEGASLVEAILDEANLGSADLTGARLIGASLVAASLYNANLTEADFSVATMTGANLREAKLDRTSLYWADLSAADMDGIYYPDARLYGAVLIGTDLTGAHMHGADLRGAVLYGADLRGAYLGWSDLTNATLWDANLGYRWDEISLDDGAWLTDEGRTDLTGANLRGADMYGADLEGAVLRGAHLDGAYMPGADLSGANLTFANMSNADLRDADLAYMEYSNRIGSGVWVTERTGTDLRVANLTGADLRGADLRGADLRGAYMYGADLRGAVACGGGLDWALDANHAGVVWDECLPVQDIADHMRPAPVSAVFGGGGFGTLDRVEDVEVFDMDGRTYAIAAADVHNGVRIMDITDPARPAPVSAVFDVAGSLTALGGAHDVEVFGAGGRTYVIVAAHWEHGHGVQIRDITDPAHPAYVSAFIDGAGSFTELYGAWDVEVFGTGGRTYAMMVSQHDDGVKIMDITDPARPAYVSAFFGGGGDSSALDLASAILWGASLYGAHDAAVFGAGGRTLAIAAAHWEYGHGVQIMDITDPARPTPVSAVFDGMEGFSALDGAHDVEVFGTGGRTYAIVAAHNVDGVQIIDITDPANMVPVSAAFDGMGGFSAPGGAEDVVVFGAGGRTYAMVTAHWEPGSGVQIMDITDPARPASILTAFDGAGGFEALGGAGDVELFDMDGRTYAVVAAYDEGGVQVIDITDPVRPAPVSTVIDGPDLALDGAHDVEVFGMDGRTYAVVAASGEAGVQLMDITDPVRPAPVSVAFDGPDLALGGAEDVEVFDMDGRTYAMVAAYDDGGVQIIDITDPANMAPVSAVFDGPDLALDGAHDVEVFGMHGRTYAVVATLRDDGVRIMDVTDPVHPTPVSTVLDGPDLALGGAWDVEVFGAGGRTYAIVTASGEAGVQVIDITDPAHPSPVSAVFDGVDGFEALAVANEMAVFGMDGRAYAIVAAYGEAGVQVIDITDPAHPSPVSAVFDGVDGFEALDGAGEMAVFNTGDRTYAMVTAWKDDGVQVIDITDPANPSPVPAVFDDTGGFTALDGARDVEVFSSGGRAYAIVASYDDDGVQIIDIGAADGFADVSADLHVANLTGTDRQIMDIPDPVQPTPVSAVFDGSGDFDALYGPRDVEVFGMDGRTYAVVAAMDDDGVQIMDITDPAHPTPVSTAFDGMGGFSALDGADGVDVFGNGGRTFAIVAAHHEGGVQIMDITDPVHPTPASAAFDGSGGFSALDGAKDVEVFGMGGRTFAIVAAHEGGVQIMDITDPAHPSPVSAAFDGSGGFSALAGADEVRIFGIAGRTYAMVAAGVDNGVQIMDITDPAHPSPVSAAFDGSGGFSALAGADEVRIFGIAGRTYAMVAAGVDNGVQIMDITDPAHPSPVSAAFDGSGGFSALAGADEVRIFGIAGRTYAIVAAHSDDGVQIMDITDPAHPSPVSAAFDGSGGFSALDGANGMDVFGVGDRTYAMVASFGDDGVQIMDITDPVHPTPVSAAFDGSGGFSALDWGNEVRIFGIAGRTYAIVTATDDDGVQIMDIAPRTGSPTSSRTCMWQTRRELASRSWTPPTPHTRPQSRPSLTIRGASPRWTGGSRRRCSKEGTAPTPSWPHILTTGCR